LRKRPQTRAFSLFAYDHKSPSTAAGQLLVNLWLNTKPSSGQLPYELLPRLRVLAWLHVALPPRLKIVTSESSGLVRRDI